MTWIKIEVFNYDSWLGSFYTNTDTKSEIINEINVKYGIGRWTRYGIGN